MIEKTSADFPSWSAGRENGWVFGKKNRPLKMTRKCQCARGVNFGRVHCYLPRFVFCSHIFWLVFVFFLTMMMKTTRTRTAAATRTAFVALAVVALLRTTEASSNVTLPSIVKGPLSLQTSRHSTRISTSPRIRTGHLEKVQSEDEMDIQTILKRRDFDLRKDRPGLVSRKGVNPWMLGSFLAVVVVTSYLSPSLWTELGQTLLQALSVAWLPVLWISPSSWPSDIWVFYKSVESSWDWFKESALPIAMNTLKSMVVAEIWRNIWSITFRQLNILYKQEKENEESSKFPAWLEVSQRFFLGTIQRGTKSMFTKTVQKHVQASVSTIFRYGLETIKF